MTEGVVVFVFVDPGTINTNGFLIKARQWKGLNYAFRVSWVAFEQ